jgi:8-oxo-dGTP diphosphatase
VVAALVEQQGRILLSQRRSDQSFPLAWEFPGGKVEPGEAPVAALVREVKEELGCTVRVDEIAEVVFHAYADFDLVMLVYLATVVAGTPSAVEVEAIAWVPPEALVTMTMPPADVPFAQALAGRSYRKA